MKKKIFFLVLYLICKLSFSQHIDCSMFYSLKELNLNGPVKEIFLYELNCVQQKPIKYFSKDDFSKILDINQSILKDGTNNLKEEFNMIPINQFTFNDNGHIQTIKNYDFNNKNVVTYLFSKTDKSIIVDVALASLGISITENFESNKGVITQKKNIKPRLSNNFFLAFKIDINTIQPHELEMNYFSESNKLFEIGISKQNPSKNTAITTVKDTANNILYKLEKKYKKTKSSDKFIDKTFLMIKPNLNKLVRSFDFGFRFMANSELIIKEKFYYTKEPKHFLIKIERIIKEKNEFLIKKSIEHRIQKIFNKNGLVIEEIIQESSQKSQNFIYEYEYDSFGNWIVKYHFDKNLNEITKISSRIIQYY